MKATLRNTLVVIPKHGFFEPNVRFDVELTLG